MTGFNLRPTEKTVVFIDGPNLYGASKIIGRDVDYRSLRTFFNENSYTDRIFYYSSILENLDQQDDHITIKPLLDWLDYNGFHVVTKYAREYPDSTGRRKIKGAITVDMAVDILLAAVRGAKHIVLFTGDGEFTPVIKAAQDLGARTTVVSTRVVAGSAPMISDDLYRQTDSFVDLKDVADLICRKREVRSYDGAGPVERRTA